MGVLEAGDELSLCLEPSDERRVVGQLGLDDLHRHFAPDDGLHAAVHRAERALGELLVQPVAADGAGAIDHVERGVAFDDAPFERGDRRGRLEAGLVGEVGAVGLEHAQGLGLPARSVQGQHQRGAGTLPERRLAGEELRLADDLAVGAEREPRLDALLASAPPQFLEATDLRDRPRLVGERQIGTSPPLRER